MPGSSAFPGGGMTSTARLRFLMDHDATVICCTPTYALHLAELAANGGDRPGRLRRSGRHCRRRAGRQHPGHAAADRSRLGRASFRPLRHDGSRPRRHRNGRIAAQHGYCSTDHYIAEVIEPAGDKPVSPGRNRRIGVNESGPGRQPADSLPHGRSGSTADFRRSAIRNRQFCLRVAYSAGRMI